MIQDNVPAITASAVAVNPWVFAQNTFFPIPIGVFRRLTEDLRKPLGTPMIYPVKDFVVRAWLRWGSTYAVHPLDCIDADGEVVPLPTTRGLMPSEATEFDWQIDTKRRLLVVAQAENELVRWAETYL